MVSSAAVLLLSLHVFDHEHRSSFTADEKLAYQEAAVCLTTVAPKLGIGNSTTLWQEMQYVHMSQVTWIHNVVRRTESEFIPSKNNTEPYIRALSSHGTDIMWQ